MKRFTETTKWDDPWFLDLSPNAKLLWLYLCDKCDNAGVVDLHERKACFEIGLHSIESELKELNTRFAILGNGKLYIESFVSFQYGELKESSNLHKSVIHLMKSHGLANPSDTHQDVIPMTPSKGKGKGSGKGKGNAQVDPLAELIYAEYPRKVGKKVAIESITKALEQIDFESLMQLVKEYALAVHGHPDKDKIPHPSTWFNQERWTDDKSEWNAWKKNHNFGNNNGNQSNGSRMTEDERTLEKMKAELEMIEKKDAARAEREGRLL